MDPTSARQPLPRGLAPSCLINLNAAYWFESSPPLAFDRTQLLVSGLSDFALHMAVPDPAPESSRPGQVTWVLLTVDPLLKILPPACTGPACTSPMGPDAVSTWAQTGSRPTAHSMRSRSVSGPSPPFIIQSDQALLPPPHSHPPRLGPSASASSMICPWFPRRTTAKRVFRSLPVIQSFAAPIVFPDIELGERPAKRREVPGDIADHDFCAGGFR